MTLSNKGSAKADILGGGAGANTFDFTTAANSSPSNFDTLSDFATGTDKIKTGTFLGAGSLHQGTFYSVPTSNASL